MIYLHIPFCHRKCIYCAFYSRRPADSGVVDDYVQALVAEMQSRQGEVQHGVRTIYFGGGTPSMLSVAQMAKIVDQLHRCFDLSTLEEVTLEANPEDLTDNYLRALSDLHFFNRLSIGVQSLDDATLRLLGRRHTAMQALEVVSCSRSVGFNNISIDLMYGLPNGQQLPHLDATTEWLRQVNHISAYALTVESATALQQQQRQGRVLMPDDDEVARQYHRMRNMLDECGFQQYEVSNFARPGFRSRHNSRYWNRTPYLGLGAASHSFDGNTRRWNVADVRQYIDCPTHNEEVLSPRDAYNELLMTALRTTDGLDTTTLAPTEQQRLLHDAHRFVEAGLLHLEAGWLRPTPEGLLHADGIAAALFL